MARTRPLVIGMLLLCGFSGLSIANEPIELTVAVASNFSAPAKRLADHYAESTGHNVRLVYGSSGKLCAQILHGAPFDIFLSADQEKPALLFASIEGAGQPVT